jgi:response regulator of citrate/malate metabolism
MSLKQPEGTGPGESERDSDGEGDPAGLLCLLNAEYTQSILETIQREQKSARAIAEECGASRPTVYRRLNALEETGLVDSGMVYDADGHHRTVFETTLKAVSVDLASDGLSVTVVTTGSDRSSSRPPRRPSD